MSNDLPRSLSALRRRFRQAAPAVSPPAPGDYLVTFVGPAALRVVAPPAIALGGMPGWRGKRFADGGPALNLVERHRGTGHDDDNRADALQTTMPMRVTVEKSWLDGRPAIVCSYGASGPVRWRWVRDEFRPLDDRRLISLTLAGGPWSRAVAAPLLLTRA